MELIEYLTVRRAYNLVRHEADVDRRLTFPEFAILCRLSNAGGALKTSEIADYQQSLRPTMTHRTKHLGSLELIEREKGTEDRRNVVCKLTDEGEAYVGELCNRCCAMIKSGQPLSRIDAERMSRYVDAMGSVSCKAGELVLLGILVTDGQVCSITGLVEMLGLLQPTVSMSVSALANEGLVVRMAGKSGARSSLVGLSDEGRERAESLSDEIAQLIVRRKQRSTK